MTTVPADNSEHPRYWQTADPECWFCGNEAEDCEVYRTINQSKRRLHFCTPCKLAGKVDEFLEE